MHAGQLLHVVSERRGAATHPLHEPEGLDDLPDYRLDELAVGVQLGRLAGG